MTEKRKVQFRRGPPKRPWAPEEELLVTRDIDDDWMAGLTVLPTERGLYLLQLEISLNPFRRMTSTADLPPRGITPALLRSVALSRLKASINMESVRAWGSFRPHKEPPELSRGRRGPIGRGDAFYRVIAEQYLEACSEDPARPIERLRENRGDGEYATVRAWVSKARKRGFLAPAVRGQRTGTTGPRLLSAQNETTTPRTGTKGKQNRGGVS
ncbi:MAG: hypothetical protein M3P01_10660 [Actinomycetota bacterium]|nr:hypothetical protein [Actinomycetota bacterium]